MDPVSKFVARCDALAQRMDITRSTLSTRILKDGKRLDQLASGRSDIGVLRLREAERLLAALEIRDAGFAE